MQLPVNLSVARTHLRTRKKQTVVAMLGVTFGIAMFILIVSFMKGMNDFFSDLLLAAIPDIHLYNDVTTDYSRSVAGDYFKEAGALVVVQHPKPKQVALNLKNAPAMLADLGRNPAVAAVSPLLGTQVFYNYGPVQINGYLGGVNILEEDKLFRISEKMTAGAIENLLTSSNGILLGWALARKLNAGPGDLVSITTPAGSTMRFRVVGIFQFGIGAVDNVKSYVNLTSVQQLLGKNRDYITDINIKLKDNKQAPVEAAMLRKKYNYKVEDWQTANASMAAGNLIRDVFAYVISVTLLLVAGFGIYNIMNMTIANKMKDIAILKAQGFDRHDILQIFLSQSLVIGVLGAFSGILLGFLLSYALTKVPFPTDESFNLVHSFPVVFRLSHYVFGIFFGLITTLLAGLMPAIKASKVDPVTILRG
jgi:lipoprotein-releasing system permease protein